MSDRKMNKKTITAIAGGAFALVIIAAALYAYTPLGAEIHQTRGFQYQPWNATWATTHAEKIVIGKVLSVETKIIDESFTSTNTYTGEPLYNEIKTPYQFVTIEVEEYIKDEEGVYSPQLIFRDFGSGFTTIEGKKVIIEVEDQTEYKIGERSLFFIERVDGYLRSQGILYKFAINSDDTVQSTYLEKTGKEPQDLSTFKAEIGEIAQRQVE